MDERAKKFISRAPRLDLTSMDNREMFFAHTNEHGFKHKTRLENISATGLAFAVPQEEAPRIGEMIKVEFTIPKHGKVAWFAKVKRIEEFYDSRWWNPADPFDIPSEVLVGVVYVDLPEKHQHSIQEGLEERFREIRNQRLLEASRDFSSFLAANFWNLVLFGLCILTTVVLLSLFSMQPQPPIVSGDDAPFFEPENNSFLYYILRGWKL